MPRAPDLSGLILERRYELHALIGEGTFGRVYRGRDRRLERAVAVKVIKPWWGEDPVWVERFAQETRMLARLSAPGIVQIYDVGEAPEGLYYVAELVDGPSLAERLRRGRLAPERAAAVAEQLARALARAHDEGIVHRDVKPANILLGRDGVLKVGDFGVARLTQGSSHAATATVIGTPQYMSPEQARGERTTPASDVYGAGVVLYEMLAGRPPFVGEAAVLLALHHLRDAPPPLPDDVPGPLREIVARALTKDPAERYADGAEMASALAGAPVGERVRSPRARRPRSPVRAALAGAAPARSPVGYATAPTEGVAASGPADASPGAAAGTAATGGLSTSGRSGSGSGSGSGPRAAPSQRRPEAWTPGTFAVSPPNVPPTARLHRRGRGRRWRAPALAIAVLVLGTVVLVLAVGGAARTRVPGVLGLHRAKAGSVAHHNHLHVVFRAAFAHAPRGTAVSQRPAAGAEVRQGATMTVTLSAGPPPVKVPALVGKGTSDATARLHALGLTAAITPVPAPGVAAGTVTDQRPRPPASAPAGSTVALQVAEVPRWHTVTTMASSGDAQSVAFRIRGARWQVLYHLTYQDVCTLVIVCFGPHATVQDVTAGSSTGGFDLSGGNNTQSLTTGPGVYQLKVGGGQDTGSWTMTVQDLY